MDLLQQFAETLAGGIAYEELTPFSLREGFAYNHGAPLDARRIPDSYLYRLSARVTQNRK
jgi:hypothetical protein